MSDQEFAAWLRSVTREVPPAEVERRARVSGITRGEYFNHHLTVHRSGESRH